MSYISPTEWADSGGHLTENLEAARVADLLAGASAYLDRLLWRSAPLTPHVAQVLAPIRPDGTVSLGAEYPPCDPDRWTCAVGSAEVLDPQAAVRATVAPATAYVPAGWVVLPADAEWATGDWLRLRMVCGYGTPATVLAPTGWTAAAGLATLTTATAHDLSAAEAVLIEGTDPSTYSGAYNVEAVPTTTTATVRIGVTPAASTVHGTVTTYTADVPPALREAAIEVARALALRDLDQRDPMEFSVSGAAKARATEIAAAYSRPAIG